MQNVQMTVTRIQMCLLHMLMDGPPFNLKRKLDQGYQEGRDWDREMETPEFFQDGCQRRPLLDQDLQWTFSEFMMCFSDLETTTEKHEFSRKRRSKVWLYSNVALKFYNWFANSNFF